MGIGVRSGTMVAGGFADLNGNVNQGREILLQVTVRPAASPVESPRLMA
tara:strand:- start:68 stop:214 length:147 start_codon:yes stop_codon:yes gene_type:complete